MAWSSATTLSVSTIGTTEKFLTPSTEVPPAGTRACMIKIDFPAGATEPAIVSVYDTVDGTNYADIPCLGPFVLDPVDGDPLYRGFLISGIWKFRVGIKTDNATALVEAELKYKDDGIGL